MKSGQDHTKVAVELQNSEFIFANPVSTHNSEITVKNTNEVRVDLNQENVKDEICEQQSSSSEKFPKMRSSRFTSKAIEVTVCYACGSELYDNECDQSILK